jgi:hypothetical protein
MFTSKIIVKGRAQRCEATDEKLVHSCFHRESWEKRGMYHSSAIDDDDNIRGTPGFIISPFKDLTPQIH